MAPTALPNGKRKSSNLPGLSPPSKKNTEEDVHDTDMEDLNTKEPATATGDIADPNNDESAQDVDRNDNLDEEMHDVSKAPTTSEDPPINSADPQPAQAIPAVTQDTSPAEHPSQPSQSEVDTQSRDRQPPNTAHTPAPTAEQPTYAEVAERAKEIEAPVEEEIEYTPRRLMITVQIGMPKDTPQRCDLLTDQLNNFLEMARKCSGKHLRVIKYSESKTIRSRDKKSWLKKFKGQGSDHLMEYVHGFYSWQKLRDGVFRFKIYLAIPLRSDQNLQSFIRVMNDSWGDPQRATVIDILGQELHSPKKIGWLFRSNRILANTPDLQQALMKHADRTYSGLKFGVTNQSIPDPNGGKWDPNTSVKAVMVEINEERYSESWQFLTNTYNKANPKPPLGIHMRFVGLKDHPEFKGNPHALHNMSTLMKRQAVFLEDSVTTATTKLVSIDQPVRRTGVSLYIQQKCPTRSRKHCLQYMRVYTGRA